MRRVFNGLGFVTQLPAFKTDLAMDAFKRRVERVNGYAVMGSPTYPEVHLRAPDTVTNGLNQSGGSVAVMQQSHELLPSQQSAYDLCVANETQEDVERCAFAIQFWEKQWQHIVTQLADPMFTGTSFELETYTKADLPAGFAAFQARITRESQGAYEVIDDFSQRHKYGRTPHV